MSLTRRSFFALASGLLIPWEPERVYSFLPGYQLWCQETLWWAFSVGKVVVLEGNDPGFVYKNFDFGVTRPGLDVAVHAHPSDEHDIRESARIFGVPLRFASHRDERDGGRA